MRAATRERVEQEVRSAFETYCRTYLRERRLGATLQLLSPKLTGFGTGRDETLSGGATAKELYRRDIEQAPERINAKFKALRVEAVSAAVALVWAEFDLSTLIDGQPYNMPGLRCSALFTKASRRWLLRHYHLSSPTRSQHAGESYPLEELQERNRLLAAQVERRTAELTQANRKLTLALENVKRLSGLLPICSICKKVRDDQGYWHQVEIYIRAHSEAEFSHGICPECMERLYSKPCERDD